MRNVVVEVCCGGIDDVFTAEKCGADRVEFCSAMGLGGLTPSFGTFLYARERASIPMMVMIRPRGSGFCYSDDEFETMLKDTKLFVNSGAEGVVFGCLTADGVVDTERCKRLIDAAGDAQTVFHRAFDVSADRLKSFGQIIDLGFNRLLTSGGCPTALEGCTLIRQLVEASNDRIEIMGGAGVRPENIVEILNSTGLNQIHLSAASSFMDTSTDGNKSINYGLGAGYDNTYTATDAQKLLKAIALVKGE